MGTLKLLKRRPWGILGAVLLLIVIFAAALAPVITSSPYNSHIGDRLQPPGGGYILGTDNLGRDVYSRLLYGARPYLEASLIALIMALIVGSVSGLIAAKAGKRTDSIFRWSIYLLSFIGIMSILFFTILFVVMRHAEFNLQFSHYLLNSTFNVPHIIWVGATMISLVLLPSFFNKFRQVFGVSSGNALTILLELSLVSLGVSLGIALSLIASPSYYGLGLPAPTPEWASTLSSVGRTFGKTAPWITLYPTIAIFVTTIGAILFGAATYDIWFPRLASPLVEIRRDPTPTSEVESADNQGL